MSALTKTVSREEQTLKLCMLHVVRVYDLTPLMRRIVLGGKDLKTFDVPSNALGPYIKLLIPPQGVEPEWPTLSPEGRLVWPPVETRPVMRTYSVRRFDKAAGEMHVDFVMHGDRGIASAWAARVQPGDPVGVWGPGCPTTQNVDWYLLAGDHTALPAIAFILENLPETAKGQAIIEIPDESEIQVFSKPSGVDIRWLSRKHRTETLQDVVKATAWPSDSRVLVWAGAESVCARSIRNYMKAKPELDRDRIHILNHWKRGLAEGGFAYLD
jgi:NADPH-dependent ferric siderophore reductase